LLTAGTSTAAAAAAAAGADFLAKACDGGDTATPHKLLIPEWVQQP